MDGNKHIELTEDNRKVAVKKEASKYGLGEMEVPTFNVKDVEQFLLDASNTGKLTEEQKNTILNIKNLDRDGDGEISLLEILSLEEDLGTQTKKNKYLKRAICALVLFFIMFLGMLLLAAYSANEISKESRVVGGTSVAKSSSGATIATAGTDSRRRLGSVITPKTDQRKRRLTRARHSGRTLRRLQQESIHEACDTCITELATAGENYCKPNSAACLECGQCITCVTGGFKLYPTFTCPLDEEGNVKCFTGEKE